MKKIGDKYTNNIFENIKHIDEQLVEVNRLSKRNNNAIANIQDYKLSRRKGAFKNKIFLKDVEED